MEKYIGICYDGEVSSPIEIETLIPREIVNQIEIALNSMKDKNWKVSSPMIDQQKLCVVFELSEKLIKGYGLKYNIIISKEY
jgi:hypothetical protein